MCVQWALATALALADFGFDSCINAGSAEFLAVPDAFDDGLSPTHFSYHWQGLSREVIESDYFAVGILPEMHAWAAIPSLGMLVDMTTRYLPELSGKAGIAWRAPRPPDCLWVANHGELPSKWIYVPSREASELAYEVLECCFKR